MDNTILALETIQATDAMTCGYCNLGSKLPNL